MFSDWKQSRPCWTHLTWTWTAWLAQQIVWGHHSMPDLEFCLSVFRLWSSTLLQFPYQPSLLCCQINLYDGKTLRINHPAEWINANRWSDLKLHHWYKHYVMPIGMAWGYLSVLYDHGTVIKRTTLITWVCYCKTAAAPLLMHWSYHRLAMHISINFIWVHL